jgi:dTMP kinase
MALHGVGSEGLLPDRTLVLALDQDEAATRAHQRDGGKADRFALKNVQYHIDVADTFKMMASTSPERFRLVSASGDPADVTARLLVAISDLL